MSPKKHAGPSQVFRPLGGGRPQAASGGGSSAAHTVEGIARVVGVDPDGGAWLEPEQVTSCGHCASADVCGSKGIGTVASRLEARRFHIDGGQPLHVGDRVVIGIEDGSLLKGALIAYAVPLLVCFIVGGIAQSLAENDLITMASMAAGLGAGLLVARLAARRMTRHGDLAPRFLRFAAPNESCQPQQVMQ